MHPARGSSEILIHNTVLLYRIDANGYKRKGQCKNSPSILTPDRLFWHKSKSYAQNGQKSEDDIGNQEGNIHN